MTKSNHAPHVVLEITKKVAKQNDGKVSLTKTIPEVLYIKYCMKFARNCKTYSIIDSNWKFSEIFSGNFRKSIGNVFFRATFFVICFLLLLAT